MKLIFCMQIKFLINLFQQFGHQNFLQGDTIILRGKIEHCQSSQSNKFAISSSYLIKEVRDGVPFYHIEKHYRGTYKESVSTLHPHYIQFILVERIAFP